MLAARSVGSLLAALLIAWSLASTAAAEEASAPHTSREVWRFGDGRRERIVDVTEYDAATRAALVERLRADGFVQQTKTAPSSRGEDLRRDVEELVRRGGRFPESPEGRRGERSLPERGPLGARTAYRARPRPHLVVLATPEGSLGRALGLERGDEVWALDDRVPQARDAWAWALPSSAQAQRTLLLRRRDGRLETWTLALERAPAPGLAPAR